MKVLGVMLLVAALVLAVVPGFTDCESEGRALTLKDGRTVPMKCHWTAQAALGAALPLAAVGGVLAFSRRGETRRGMGIAGLALGALTILLPTALIGVCANPDMICNSTMRPILILTGALIMAISAAAIVLSVRASARHAQQVPVA